MNIKVGVSRHKLLSRWWLRTREVKNIPVPLTSLGYPIEFYVPFWAWPLEILHRLIFGTTKINCNTVNEIKPNENT